MTTAYPLTWPDHIPRSKSRERGKFSTQLLATLNKAKADALRAIGAN